MKITPDTNVLLRPLLEDNADEARLATKALADAEIVVVTTPSLCEYVWVLRQGYKKSRSDIALAIRTLINIRSVRLDRAAVEAGVAMLEAGADFADGVIAFEGERLGGEVFISFDAKAVRRIRDTGAKAELLRS